MHIILCPKALRAQSAAGAGARSRRALKGTVVRRDAEPDRRPRHVNSKTSDETPEGGTRAGGADGTLGEQLRRARNERGISLREISEQTRITMRHLEAIEAD